MKYDDMEAICGRCGERYGDHSAENCPDGTKDGFVPSANSKPALAQPEPETEHHNPGHYRKKSVEPIDAMRSWLGDVAFVQYCRGSVIKYLARLGEKDESVKEARKAEVYLRWMREALEGKPLTKGDK